MQPGHQAGAAAACFKPAPAAGANVYYSVPRRQGALHARRIQQSFDRQNLFAHGLAVQLGRTHAG